MAEDDRSSSVDSSERRLTPTHRRERADSLHKALESLGLVPRNISDAPLDSCLSIALRNMDRIDENAILPRAVAPT